MLLKGARVVKKCIKIGQMRLLLPIRKVAKKIAIAKTCRRSTNVLGNFPLKTLKKYGNAFKRDEYIAALKNLYEAPSNAA